MPAYFHDNDRFPVSRRITAAYRDAAALACEGSGTTLLVTYEDWQKRAAAARSERSEAYIQREKAERSRAKDRDHRISEANRAVNTTDYEVHVAEFIADIYLVADHLRKTFRPRVERRSYQRRAQYAVSWQPSSRDHELTTTDLFHLILCASDITHVAMELRHQAHEREEYRRLQDSERGHRYHDRYCPVLDRMDGQRAEWDRARKKREREARKEGE